MNKVVFAVAAHPDDIEFMMSGTMFLLKEAGCEIHYMNIANGDCGTAVHEREEIARIRRGEAMEAAQYLGATFHESLVSDLEIYYERETLARVTSVMRDVNPDILLVQYPHDYMEDHNNACRLAVSAAFNREMRNATVEPYVAPVSKEITAYHAMPYGLYDPMRNLVQPEMFVDISSIIEKKTTMLAKHTSQKEWLDASQGMDSYLIEMKTQVGDCGKMSGRFEYAEGWSRRLHLGLGSKDADPLKDLIGDKIVNNPAYQK